jgi:hypothetical protein
MAMMVIVATSVRFERVEKREHGACRFSTLLEANGGKGNR